MNKMAASIVLALFFISACSSHHARAPVNDITLGASSGIYVANIYVANNKGGYKGSTYKVKSGDTLYAIAWKTGTEVSYLISRNKLKSNGAIYKGQTLQLSGAIKRDQTPRTYKKLQQRVEHDNKNKYDKSNSSVTKKSVATKKKVRSWQWPSNGKLIKKFQKSKSTAALQGISIANKRGSAIKAAADGKVVYAGGGLRGYGNLVIIKHNNDYLSAYAHNEKLLVKEKQMVKKGQKIALMGDSGTNAVYLHFEIRYRGKSVDPLRYLPKK
jgi:lipoprotein NlpD